MTITNLDYRVLSALRSASFPSRQRSAAALSDLDRRLEGARRVGPQEVPEDLVTMDSIVMLRELSSGLGFCAAIVFPWAAKPRENRVSVLSEVGRAVLGRREGDVVVCRDAGRCLQLRIEEVVFQPEAHTQEALHGS